MEGRMARVTEGPTDKGQNSNVGSAEVRITERKTVLRKEQKATAIMTAMTVLEEASMVYLSI